MKAIIEQMTDELIEIRRSLHQSPELGFEEYATARLIADCLKSAGAEVTEGVAKTGVVGLVRGRAEGKTLLIRADIDALPVQEEGTAAYRSQTDGVMHACGHDVHTSISLGVAKVMCALRDTFDGNVKLVFQPAEESLGGALPMIEAGVMENPKVDGAAAYHVWDLPLGTIGIKSGGVTASPDHFHIVISGKGGHGAMPELCVNPIAIGSEIVSRLGKLTFDQPSVISICSFLSGTGENIIPDTALLKGTARAIDRDTRQKIYEAIAATCEAVTADFGADGNRADARLEYRFLYPPAQNDGAMTELFADAAKAVIGGENIIRQQKPDMIGDDFAYFAERVPSVYVKLGGAAAPLHTACFDVDERCIAVGVEMMCRFALDFLS